MSAEHFVQNYRLQEMGVLKQLTNIKGIRNFTFDYQLSK
jgi:hypothetical protein